MFGVTTPIVVLALVALAARGGEIELVRDRWGVPHAFAANETDGFHGIGFATAEDRLVQMDLFRRRANSRLAEVFGARLVDSDRKFRIAGIGRHCREVVENLPGETRSWLAAYAEGVNAWVKAYPQKVSARMAPLGVAFDRVIDEGASQMYNEFARLPHRRVHRRRSPAVA